MDLRNLDPRPPQRQREAVEEHAPGALQEQNVPIASGD
jgi:hypothetical protein